MKTPFKIALFFVLFLVLGGITSGLYLFNKQHKDLQKVKPDFIVSASGIQKEFEENETAAVLKYVNKIIEVSGIISSVKTSMENASSITLRTGSDLSAVICTFPPSADISGLAIGGQVTVRGECSGFLMDVLFNNCVLIK